MLERNFRAAACIKLGTSVPQGRMSRAPSPLWDHFYMPDGDFRRAMCSHCGDQVRRGKEGAPKSTCYNAPMQHHMKVRHKDLMEGIERAQEVLKPGLKLGKVDPKDETARAQLPLFRLRTKSERAEWMKLVSIKVCANLLSQTLRP